MPPFTVRSHDLKFVDVAELDSLRQNINIFIQMAFGQNINISKALAVMSDKGEDERNGF